MTMTRETSGARRSYTILLADDSPVNLGMVVASLERHAYEVLVATDGEEVLQRAAITMPDLILLDVMMPGLNGLEVCRRLKARDITRDIPVIFMTSLSSVQDKVAGFEAGAVDYVTKPLQINEVQARVSVHLKMRELQRKLEGGNLALRGEVEERRRIEIELLRRENEFRTLLENSPDTVTRYDRECRHIYCNLAALRFMGIAADEVLGRTLVECSPYPSELAEEITALVRRVLDTGQPGEIELQWEKASETAWLQFRVSPEFDADGRVVSVLSIGRDVSTLKRSQIRLYKTQEMLHTLWSHQDQEREEERKRMAWYVHEELGQNLMALRLNLSLLLARLGESEEAALLASFESTRKMLDHSIDIARNVSITLRPKVLDLGIVAALEWLADEFTKKTTIACEVEPDAGEIRMNETWVVATYRIAEEALGNVARHAGATWVRITLERRSSGYFLSVLDDGGGFDPKLSPENSFGLLEARERAYALGGELRILSSAGKGTVVEVRIPTEA